MRNENAPFGPAGRALPPQSREGLLTLRQVAEFLAVSDKTVRRLVAAGRLHCVRVGRVLRFQPADLFRYVEAWKE